MTKRNLIAAALLTSVTLAGGLAATAASDTGSTKRAASQARDAQKALGKHKIAKAVAGAEAAVALDPRNAAYRTLLGKAYLAAGRFPSAVGALGDALSLDPSDGAAALHLALAQIAVGQWDAARNTLSTHEATIPASDRGLAFALAGDPGTAVAVLTQAARGPDSDAKTRQNLALSLALAGRWSEAKAVASFDMSPADVDGRIEQWAAFARPTGAADQVAALLGVVPVEDPGQPERLALVHSNPTVAVAAAQTVPAAESLPVAVAAGATPAAAPEELVAAPPPVAAPAPVAAAPLADVGEPVVANIGKAPIVAAPTPVRPTVARVAPVRMPKVVATRVQTAKAPAAAWTPARGNFYVQLGAYDNAGVAKDAWGRLSHRISALGGHAPSGAKIATGGKQFYRLAVGGFARGDADTLCRKVRAGGGRCFVRAGAGDAVAAWVRPTKGVQLAMR